MKNDSHKVICLVVFIMFVLIYVVFSERQTLETPQVVLDDDIISKSWETQIDDQLSVTVKVTPIDLGKESTDWRFGVVLDTHSGSLDTDMIKDVLMIDDTGRSYEPVSWSGPGPGGHHRDGTLTFKAVYPFPKFVELKIKNVGGVSERLFKWSLK